MRFVWADPDMTSSAANVLILLEKSLARGAANGWDKFASRALSKRASPATVLKSGKATQRLILPQFAIVPAKRVRLRCQNTGPQER